MAKNKIQYTGEFDVSGILNSLKAIENQMKDMSETNSIFSGVDKDFDKISKLIINIKSQLSQGFSDSKDIASFSKNINSLYENLNHIKTELKEISASGKLEIKGASAAREEIKEYKDGIKDLEKSLKTTKKELSGVFQNIGYKKSDADGIAAEISNINDLENKLKEIIELRKKAFPGIKAQAKADRQEAKAKARAEISNLVAKDGVKVIKETDEVSNQKEARARVNKIASDEMSKVLSGSRNIKEAWEKIQERIEKAGIELINNEAVANKLQKIYSQLQSSIQKIENNLSSAKNDVEVLGEMDSKGDISFSKKGNGIISRFSDKMPEDIENKISKLKWSIEDLQQKIQKLENLNGLEGITEQLENIQKATDEARVSSKQYIEDTEEIIKTQERMAKGFNKIKDGIKNFLSLGSAISGLRQIFNETFEDIKTLDKSFADIAMVTDYSVGEMWQSYDQYAEMANELGQTTNSVIQASGLFYQQGLDTNESLELTEDTMKLATLANLDFTEATSQMTAALRGFKMEMDEGARVTDVYSELAAKAAADVEGISYAMTKTASIAESAGMEFETTAAFLTQMIETTQEAPKQKPIV